MNIQGYQKLTLLDFPGKVACTVFTGGCNLKCPFCHNAGLVSVPFENDSAETEVLSYLAKRCGILDGVCVTGGEPLLQSDLSEFLEKVRDMGFLIKLDTNGSLPTRLKEVLEAGLVDFVAMDIKSSHEGYPRAVGKNVDMTPFLQSIDIIKSSGVEYEFRTTAVRGIHTLSDFESVGQWLKGEKRYFIQKFVDSGNILSDGCSSFSDEEYGEILDTVRKYIPEAQLRG